MSGFVRMDVLELQRLIDALGGNLDEAIRNIAFAVEAEAKMRAPVDTGAMANSIYTVTSKEDGFGQAGVAAVERNSEVGLVELPTPPDWTAYVGPSVDYAEFVELGTSRQAAQPFLTPALESVTGKVNSGEYFRELTK